MDNRSFLFIFLIIICETNFSDSVCIWPSAFESSTWSDSSYGELVFGTNSVSGFTFTVNGQTISNWRCAVADTFKTDGRLILLSSSSFNLYDTTFYAYRCMTFTKVTEASYRYYQNNKNHELANNERLLINPSSSLTSLDKLCNITGGASGSEFQMIIKKGSEASAKIDCPYLFLGVYGYTHTDENGIVTCNTVNSSWDMCADNAVMMFDYTKCSTKVAYSETNTVWCVDSLPIGSTNYVMVYNGGDSDENIDNVNVYRYSCFAASMDGTKASVTPQHCKAGQTFAAIPTNNAGTKIGAMLNVTLKETCASCPTLAAPERGFVTITTEGAITKAVYECQSNYTLFGVSERFCQSYNNWTDTEPSCSCASPPTPDNGVLVISKDGYQANYTCNIGFSLKGLQIRQCILVISEWEDVDPECVLCTTIDRPTGGAFVSSSNGVATMISFTCDKGYSLSGSHVLTCLANGTWDEATPTCAKCPTLTNPISGTVSTSTDGLVTKAMYSCAAGYRRDGAEVLTCLDTGNWNFDPPKCVCESPSSPGHGTVVANGSVAIYTCEMGYSINGVAKRTCMSDGTGWSGADPSCSLCVAVDQPVGGAVTLSTDGTTTYARYTCKSGYTLSGAVEIICESDGNWNTEFSSCAQCQTLSSPGSGTYTLSTSGTVTSAIYSCFEGYILKGATTRECLSDGTWQNTDPTCICRSPPSVNNGKLVSDGSTSNYTCYLGYSLNGPNSRICQNDGSGWTGFDPSCEKCTVLANRTGGSVVMSTDGLNTRASFACQVGYTLNGESTITCRSNGSWDFQQPTCVSCPNLASPDSGEVSISTDGYTTKAVFSCTAGYYLNGDTTLTCRTIGAWTNSPPTCKCSFPVKISNGEVAVSDASGISVATYKCENGFTLNGPSTRQCQTEGAGWTGSDPVCVSCPVLSDLVSGYFTYSTNGVTTKAIFHCDPYTSMNGENILSCQASGTWDHPTPICVNCSALTQPLSGSVTVSTNGVTSTAFYSCVSGYSLSSSGLLTCLSNGTWDLPVPSCVCDAPPSPTNGEVDVLNDGLLASYSCNAGYELLGDSERFCFSDGTGWNGTHPICVEILATSTTTEKPGEIVPVHMAILIVLGVVIGALVLVLVIVAVKYYKGRSTKIGSSSERLMEEPEKPKILPEVSVPPNDTAKTDSKIPLVLAAPPTKKTGPRKKPKLKRRPSLDKSPTILSASGIGVENLQIDGENQESIENITESATTGSVLTEANEVSSKTRPKLKKTSASKKLAQNNQDAVRCLPEPLRPNLVSPISSMDMATASNKTLVETKENIQNNETNPAINLHSVRLPPVTQPPIGHGVVIKRKRKRLGFRSTIFKDDIRESRPRTPIEKRMKELGIERIMTPDLLQQVAFNYIHPVIIHDAPSSSKDGRPSTAMSSRTFASYT